MACLPTGMSSQGLRTSVRPHGFGASAPSELHSCRLRGARAMLEKAPRGCISVVDSLVANEEVVGSNPIIRSGRIICRSGPPCEEPAMLVG